MARCRHANAGRRLQLAPHATYDLTTENQAINIFGTTDSRSYVMAGAHRNANSGSSSCQSSYAPAGAAHNINNMFHQTQIALMAFYGNNEWQAIQWHGMAVDSCDENAFLSHGMTVNPAPGDKNLELKTNMEGKHPTWNLGTPVSGGCSLNATDNVQGRLINGVPAANVCTTAASSYNGKFLHIEQDPGFRTPSDWIPSVNEIWGGAGQTPPPAPTNLGATGGNAQVSLSWTAASGADTYNVHRATVSGGPYGTITTGIATTSHVDNTVTNGITYFYVVSGQNEAGEGPDSNQASASRRRQMQHEGHEEQLSARQAKIRPAITKSQFRGSADPLACGSNSILLVHTNADSPSIKPPLSSKINSPTVKTRE